MLSDLAWYRSFHRSNWKGMAIFATLTLLWSLIGCAAKTAKYQVDSTLPSADFVTLYGSFNNPEAMAKEVILIEEVDGKPVSDHKTVRVSPGKHQLKVLFFWKKERFWQKDFYCTFPFDGTAGHEYVIRAATENYKKNATREYLYFNYRFWVEDKASKDLAQDCYCKEWENK